jgi:hypothetical protein
MLILAIAGIYVWNNTTHNSKSLGKEQVARVAKTSEQYKMGESFEGSQTQIIDLIEGKALFDLRYGGDSQFSARLLNTDGSVFSTLADKTGPCEIKQTIEVPATGPYLLDVKTEGTWTCYRE